MKKIILGIFSLFFLISCTQQAKIENYVLRINKKFNSLNIHNKKSEVVAYHLGIEDSKLNTIHIYLYCFSQDNFHESRAITIGLMNQYLELINSGKNSQNYLSKNGITTNHLEMTVFFVDSQGNKQPPPNVGIIKFRNNKLYYYYQDLDTKRHLIKEESLKKATK